MGKRGSKVKGVGGLPWKSKRKDGGAQGIPVQEVPFPEKPVLQAQEKVPGPVEVQVPFGEQLLVPPPTPVQLLMEMQVVPFPEYPPSQAHVYVPGPV